MTALATPVRKKRGYDRQVLGAVWTFVAPTMSQVVDTAFVQKGRGASYGYRLIKRLVREGKLETWEAFTKGAPRTVGLTLTAKGLRALGVSKLPARDPRTDQDLRLYAQYTEVRIVRLAEGWRTVSAEHAFPHLKALALSRYRGRPLTSTEQQERALLEKLEPVAPSLDILVNDAGECRWVLLVRSRAHANRALESIGVVPFLPPLDIEVVSPDYALHVAGMDVARRWMRKTNRVGTCHFTHHYALRGSPLRRAKGVEGAE